MENRWFNRFIKVCVPTLLIGVIAWCALARPLDDQATEQIEAGIKRTLVTFAVARSLNAVISVAQGTEFSVAPAGVGLTFTPGQVLDPVNDLIERFSWFMLMSSVSLGAQRVLIELSSWPPFSIALVVLLVIAWGSHFRGGLQQGNEKVVVRPWVQHWLRNLALVMLVLRFAVPVTALASEWAYSEFLAVRHVESEARLAQARDRVEAVNEEVQNSRDTAESKGLLERARDWASDARQRVSSMTNVNRYKAAVAETSRDTVELIVVFLLHTVVVPIAVLLLIWAATKKLLMIPVGSSGPN